MRKLFGRMKNRVDSRQSSHSRGPSTSSSGRMPPADQLQPQPPPQLQQQQQQQQQGQPRHQHQQRPPSPLYQPHAQHQRHPSVVIPPRRLPPLSHTPTPSSASPDMAHVLPEAEMQKRKRDVDDSGVPPGGHQRQKSAGGLSPGTSAIDTINYLVRPNAERLPLMQGDADALLDLINLVYEYEGVLDRQESFAANLGAKLTGPRLLKGIERFFDGPIRTNSPQPFANPVSWLDVVAFAKARPDDFVLTTIPSGARCCQFVCKGLQVEITEDDWRLISSGALDRFPLEHPFEEDETAELATLDILEQRSAALYKRADELASRARILHHKFGHRKHSISRRRRAQDGGGGGSNRFSPVNAAQRVPVAAGSYDLHADLLQQFATAPGPLIESRSTSGAGVSVVSTSGPMSPSVGSHHHRLSGQSVRSSVGGTTAEAAPVDPGQLDALRGLITQRTEKLAKGDTIAPPCDRCRRLRLQCVKHLTACQGCTKKHAKCSWRSVTDDEAARLRHEMGVAAPGLDSEAGPGMGANAEPPPIGPRGSISIRIPEEVTPPGGRSMSMMSTMAGRDPESRPESRGDPGGMMIYSPKTLPNGRTEMEPEVRRTSLPHGQGPGPGPGMGGSGMGMGMHLEAPRDQARLSQMASMATVSVAETGQSVGSLLNPRP